MAQVQEVNILSLMFNFIGSSELAGKDVNNKIPEVFAGQRIETSKRHLKDHLSNFCYDLVIERFPAISPMVSSVKPLYSFRIMQLTASLVLYKNDPEIVIQAIKSLFGTPIEINLSVVDNSPTDELKTIFDNFHEYDIDYYFNNGNNVGFGQAHNLAITRAKNYDYHLVINPDVYFDNNVITELIHYLDKHQEVGLITPKISYPNGDIQYLCKRQPTVLTLFIRRFIPKKMQFLFKKRLDWYEMRDISYNQIVEVPIISGCFMLFNRKYLDDIGYFDKNMFMYFEDYDLTIRMSKKYKTILYPHVNIYHHWARGAHNSTKLAIVFAQSAVYFFNKHGWKLY